ncbi:MAG TPA: thymidine phosphorylase [Mycobacterium sp.]|nr:thymidine phosphorylase [Mycobacterium sp.]
MSTTAGDASAHLIEAIIQKRGGQPLDSGQIARIVDDFLASRVPDYQMSAWLATVACQGMNLAETTALTGAYVDSVVRLRLGDTAGPVLDKHSTGGVGDKVSLVVVPVVAACGVAVAKMSGRGLGHAGGTVDKLESIPGLGLDLPASAVRRILSEVGMVITGSSDELAPGDRATYALRDVTGTVDSIPLIAASIVSKKIAVGADALLLDVKAGSGALTPDPGTATRLAETMVEVAQNFGLRCQAVLTDMSRPLGCAVGNALEVKEALAVLAGEHVPGLSELCRFLSRLMLQLADPDLSDGAADRRVDDAFASRAGYQQFVRWATAQGADTGVFTRPDRLPAAAHRATIVADRPGWVTAVDARAIGCAALRIGAGRLVHGAALDHAAGVLLLRRIGDYVEPGDMLAEVHYSRGDPTAAIDGTRSAFMIDAERPLPPPVVHRIVSDPSTTPASSTGCAHA